ncbi:hypothetical protein BC835DRAFT_1516533 [Cytidiella melzeri]|nr:hypothetical protein BC835DRAFT_1516533 [Cytidiella melzeri]
MANLPPPPKRLKKLPSAQTRSGFRGFVHVTEAVASGAVPSEPPRELSNIYLDHLLLDAQQHTEILAIYHGHKNYSQKFDAKDEQDQLTASAVLAANLIDFDDLEALQNKWCSRWSKRDGAGEKETRRVLYQCSCGYNHTERGSTKRKNPFDSTGCLAHCEILYYTQTHRVILIRGYLEHNEDCRTSPISRSPVWPVHPSVYEDALRRLKAGVSLEEVKRVNRELFATHGYKEMPRDLATSRYRWLLVGKDNRSLYRQFHRLRGVKIVQKDHINLHEWLDRDSPQFNETLKKAIFHYVPRTKHEGRLEVCIATSEMKAAAWKYGHHNQVLLDGTFGISDKKMLLFIVMGIDEANRGVPLAFLLFSAPASNQKTAAGNGQSSAAVPISQSSESPEPSTPFTLDPITRASLAINEIVRESADLDSSSREILVAPVSDDLHIDASEDAFNVGADTEYTTDGESGYTTPEPVEDEDEDGTSSVATSDRPAYGGDFAELERSNQQALNEQTIARTFHDLEKVTPKLEQLSEWLSKADLETATDADIQRAQYLRSSLKGIVGQLDRMLHVELHVDSPPYSYPPSLSPLPRSLRTKQRTYPAIMAPPVEKRAQKRRESYGVH